ncbi:MAG: ABC transporter permease [Ruminococcus sp.]|nr:ABC transporter permease [Ruminococcus sp.]
MQVFKAFMKVLKKKMSYAIIYIGIFLGIVIPMATTQSNSGSVKEMFSEECKSSIALCIFDEDDSPESRAFSDYLGEKYTLKSLENDEEVLMNALYYFTVDRIITINKGFSDKLAKGEINGIIDSQHMHETTKNMLLDQDINSYFSAVSAYVEGGADTLSASRSAQDALMTDADVNAVSFKDDANDKNPDHFFSYFRILPYILTASIIGTLCPILMIMNKKEVRFRTNCSSLRPSSYTKQVFLGSALFVVGVWIIFMIAAMIIYGGIFSGKAWLAVLNSFIYSMVAASIAVFLSTFITNVNIISFVNQIISLGMSFTCGVFVEQELLSKGILSAARFLPAYWYIKANMMLDGTEVYSGTQFAQYLAIEAAFAAVIAILTLVVSKARYNSTALPKVRKLTSA